MTRRITDIVTEGEALGVVGGVAASLAVGATSEQIDDRVAALLAAGANVTLTYDDAAGTLTIAAAGGGSVAVEDEGAEILASAARFDFTGAGVTVTDGGAGQANIAIPGGGGGAGWTAVASFIGTEAITGWTAVTATWTNDAGGFWRPDSGTNAVLSLNTNLFPYEHVLVQWEQKSPTDGSGASRGGVALMETPTTLGDYQPAGGRTHAGSGWAKPGATTYYDVAPASGADAAGTWTAMKALFTPNTVEVFCKDEWLVGAYSGADVRRVGGRLALWTQDGKSHFRNLTVHKLVTALP